MRQRPLFEPHVGMEVDLGRLRRFVTEPECDHRQVDATLQEGHGCGVTERVWADRLCLEWWRQPPTTPGHYRPSAIRQPRSPRDCRARPADYESQGGLSAAVRAGPLARNASASCGRAPYTTRATAMVAPQCYRLSLIHISEPTRLGM